MTSSDRWPELTEFSEEFTCYSAAIATWIALGDADWRAAIDPSLWLALMEHDDGLFGFGHFRPGLRAGLGLVRVGAGTAREAIEGIAQELSASGRVIVAGDGFALPWHVAYARRHVPHWFVITAEREILDPFACRNELGVQAATRMSVQDAQLPALTAALPAADPVYELREALAFGDLAPRRDGDEHQWFVQRDPGPSTAPSGPIGPEAVTRLARHFEDNGADASAYRQADDLWSIARHRAFLAKHLAQLATRSGDARLAAWVSDHGRPLAGRWAHIAPLIMQAQLALMAGRAPTGSVSRTLTELAQRESDAAGELVGKPDAGSISDSTP